MPGPFPAPPTFNLQPLFSEEHRYICGFFCQQFDNKAWERNNLFSFFPSSQTKKKTLTEKHSRKRYCDRSQR